MEDLLKKFAEGYSRHWEHEPARRDQAFVDITVETPVPPQARNIPDATGFMTGRLIYGGEDDEPDHLAGFRTCMGKGFEYPTQGMVLTQQQDFWRKHYPCAHVPLVLPEGFEPPRSNRQTIEIPMQNIPMQNIPFQMPPGFQLAPGIEMVDGFPRWVGGEEDAGEDPGMGMNIGGEAGAGGVRITGVHFVGWAPMPGAGATPTPETETATGTAAGTQP
jgi:hypothetical protein